MRQWLFRTRSDVMWFVSAGLFALVIFFRQQLRSAFARVFGDRIDGLIEIAHLEHWHNVLRGVSPWDRTLWYFPNPDTVGYNDGYLLYGLAYGFFRVIGADAFVASDLTNMGVKAVGFLGFVLFARRFAGASMPVAAVFALIFTIANASYANAYHAQLFSVGFAPLLAFWIGIAIGNAPHRPGRAAGYGALVAAFYAAWMMTAFYTAWFFAYGAAFLLLFLALLATPAERHRARAWVRRSWRPMGLAGAIFAIGLLPFLHVYWPAARRTGMHDFHEVSRYLPALTGLLNVGPGNLVYGRWDLWLSQRWGTHFSMDAEQIMGMPWGLLACGVAGAVLCWSGRPSVFWRALALATFVSWLATTRLHGHPLWHLFYRVVPAAPAVRVICRYELFLTFPVTLLAMRAIMRIGQVSARRGRLALLPVAPLLVFLVIEEINLDNPLSLVRAHEDARLAAIPAAPANCRSFYAVNARPDPKMPPGFDSQYSHNVDAMFIAEMRGIPTLNGIDSFSPPGWNLFGYDDPTYPARVRDDIAQHRLTHVCALDLRTSQWRDAPPTTDAAAPP